MVAFCDGPPVNALPSRRAPYMTCQLGFMRQRSLAARNAFHSAPSRTCALSVLVKDAGTFAPRSANELYENVPSVFGATRCEYPSRRTSPLTLTRWRGVPEA